jgi:galactokinase
MSKLGTIQTDFAKIFGAPPERVARAPGRVNLIGEHTDYNGGFVLPIAIDRQVLIAARRRDDHRVRMVALDFLGEPSEFSLDAAIERDEAHPWSNYIRGVAFFLQQRGLVLPGLDLVIHGDVPIGSGLASSAALEVCVATTFQAFGGFGMDKVNLAQLCQKAENDFVGVKSGVMDQFIAALARAGHALLIDCRDLTYEYAPLLQGATVVVCDTMKRRGLAASEYNTRRVECEVAARLLGAKMLRAVLPSEFAKSENNLPPNVAQRARHVITENTRVLDAVTAMKRNDLTAFGRLMNESHQSLRDDYKVSCAELDAMVEIAHKQSGCLGARLTGAGFRGCTVNLVADGAVEAFSANVAREYHTRVGIEPQIYACHAVAGAGVVV